MLTIPFDFSAETPLNIAVKLISAMVFPDDEKKAEAMCVALLANKIVDSIVSENGEDLNIKTGLHKLFVEGTGFLNEHLIEIAKRRRYGDFTAGMFFSYLLLKHSREALIRRATNERKRVLSNERWLMPSRRQMVEQYSLLLRDVNDGDRVPGSGQKELYKAWALMEPVAHFWAAESMIDSEQWKARLAEEKKLAIIKLGADDDELEMALMIRPFLCLAKQFLANSFAQDTFSEKTFLIDPAKAIWVEPHIDEWLGPIIQVDFSEEIANQVKALRKRSRAKTQ